MKRRTALAVPFALAALLFAPPATADGEPGAVTAATASTPTEAPRSEIVVRPQERPRRVGERIDLSLRDADLVEVLRSFAKLGGFNLVIHPAVKGKVTVELRDVPWDAALVTILRSHGLAAEVDGRIVSVAPRPAGR